MLKTKIIAESRPINVGLLDNSGRMTELNKASFQNIFGANYANRILVHPVLLDALPKIPDPYIPWPPQRDLKPELIPSTDKTYICCVSRKIGWGLFARERIHRGELLGIYGGLLRYHNRSSEKYAVSYPAQTPRRIVLDGHLFGNQFRFMNHSENPSAQITQENFGSVMLVIVRAIRPLAQNEQLTINYGPAYWANMRIKPAEL